MLHRVDSISLTYIPPAQLYDIYHPDRIASKLAESAAKETKGKAAPISGSKATGEALDGEKADAQSSLKRAGSKAGAQKDIVDQVCELPLEGLVQLWQAHGDGTRSEDLMLRVVKELPDLCPLAEVDGSRQGSLETAAPLPDEARDSEQAQAQLREAATAEALRRIMEDMSAPGEAMVFTLPVSIIHSQRSIILRCRNP